MLLDIVDCYIIDHARVKHNKSHDIWIKVLVALKYLGTGCTFDFLEESSGISEEMCHCFTCDFCFWFNSKFRLTHIHLPETEAEVEHVEGLYGWLGLPGCIGSVDCVYILWEPCPAGLQSSCKGKEGYPTLVFKVIVSYAWKFLSLFSVFFGADNGKTIAQYDPAISAVCNGEYSENEREHCCKDGTRVKEKGYFLFVMAVIFSPVQHTSAGSDVDIWSKFVESVQKDIECMFGILKKWFLALKHDVQLMSKDVIHKILISCCILHNMLLDFDGWEECSKYVDEVVKDDEFLWIHVGWNREEVQIMRRPSSMHSRKD